MKVKVHPLFVLLMAFAVWTPYLTELLWLFGTVILHELGHVAAAAFYGYKIREIEILPFGGVAKLEHGSMGWQPRHETVIAIAGPVVNFVLLLLVIASGRGGWLDEAAVAYLTEMNLTLAFFNLLPALPLDGGRILRAGLARTIGFQKATGVAITMAFTLSCILLVLGLGALWAGFVQLGMITLGIFLLVSAWQLRRQLQYDTIRFLDTKHRQRLKRPLPVRSIAARMDTSLLKVMGEFAPDAYHIVYIVDDQSRQIRMLMEEELLEFAMRPGSARLKVGDLIS